MRKKDWIKLWQCKGTREEGRKKDVGFEYEDNKRKKEAEGQGGGKGNRRSLGNGTLSPENLKRKKTAA